MEYRSLAGVDPPVSRIGFGCWGIGGHGYGAVEDAESVLAIQAAVESGITLFDTADVYGFGHSETILGKALRGYWDRAVVSTKFGVVWDDQGRTRYDSSPHVVRSAVEASLGRLGLDTLDLVLMHWPDGVTPVAETMGELSRLRDEGKLRAFGVSNTTGEVLDNAVDSRAASAAQFELSVVRQRYCGDAERARAAGALTVAYGALGRGVLTGGYRSGHRFGPHDTRGGDAAFHGEELARRLRMVQLLEDCGRPHGRSSAQVALRWVLDSGPVDAVIVGVTKAAQAIENATVCEWRLSPDEVRILQEAGRRIESDEESAGAEVTD